MLKTTDWDSGLAGKTFTELKRGAKACESGLTTAAPVRISWSRLRAHSECPAKGQLLSEGKKSTIADIRGYFHGTVVDNCMRRWLSQENPQKGQMLEWVDQMFLKAETDARESGDGVVGGVRGVKGPWSSAGSASPGWGAARQGLPAVRLGPAARFECHDHPGRTAGNSASRWSGDDLLVGCPGAWSSGTANCGTTSTTAGAQSAGVRHRGRRPDRQLAVRHRAACSHLCLSGTHVLHWGGTTGKCSPASPPWRRTSGVAASAKSGNAGCRWCEVRAHARSSPRTRARPAGPAVSLP
jgi:hypothetical protein